MKKKKVHLFIDKSKDNYVQTFGAEQLPKTQDGVHTGVSQ